MTVTRRKTARKPKTSALLVDAARALSDAVQPYVDGPPPSGVEYVLNPLDYGWEAHHTFLKRHAPAAPGQVEAVLVGMNPGPWGMAQTGVPFGTPSYVRGLLGITRGVVAPARFHEKRPILGIDSTREEVSGKRLWGAVADCFGSADAFFARFFVLNYCPLVFQSATGANVTPDKMKKAETAACFAACDEHLLTSLRLLAPRTVIGVGKWAEKKVKALAEAHGLDLKVGSILHPSPASPLANRGWLPVVLKQLEELGHPWPAPRDGA
jgi:single-strand selective monofunctional uracil DNA glycosylase